MRGEVLKSDGPDGAGLILGEDGMRYQFSQVQVRNGAVLQPGRTVDFVGMGEEARDIYALGAAAAPAQPAPAQPAYAGAAPMMPTASYAAAVPLKGDGLWTYFTRALTKNYFQFNGRARRSEYWGYTLFVILTFIVALVVDGILSVAFYGTTEYGDPQFIPILTILFGLYQIIPSIAITVRRLHDQDLSGWLYLISFVPYVGGLILLVFMILDSKPAPNKHGPSPKYMGVTTADTFA
ncbi:MAG: hypothetical protein VR74_18120 [Hyphomonas sp. BRH_c22]|uniref:DUF805 domain-containing protein n=1 Tax=Hyphomonas sp. BRH_c22 TaxID=1629710 RepID=UPI0005F17EA8|nr:DUF805 domain-containing protein [Hyphomonas sp. BRH_c22]KJS35068.1 MAG: hypothetical protein VR74_18120 [Hyphomonas sp. BRH_c22]